MFNTKSFSRFPAGIFFGNPVLFQFHVYPFP